MTRRSLTSTWLTPAVMLGLVAAWPAAPAVAQPIVIPLGPQAQRDPPPPPPPSPVPVAPPQADATMPSAPALQGAVPQAVPEARAVPDEEATPDVAAAPDTDAASGAQAPSR